MFKILLFVLSLFAIIISSFFLSPHLIKINHSNPSILLNLCDQDQDFDSESCLLILSKSLKKMTMKMKAAAFDIENLRGGSHGGLHTNDAVADCLELMEMSIDRVGDVTSTLTNLSNQSDVDDAHTWLSGILTNHVTCLDGLIAEKAVKPSKQVAILKVLLEDLILRTRRSLAILARVSSSNKDFIRPLNGGFPSWILAKDRKLLESDYSLRNIKANVVVAKDGSGKYKKIQEAVDSVPDKSKSRFVIYVKRGIYEENVEVGKKKKNVMIVGDGMDLTVITGSLNVVDGSTTFKSATLAVAGDGFILQDIRVQNTAGPEKHQAVALRVSADKSVINRCRIDAYQDTLYAHNFRQFYRDCSILGTIDFIFGNAAVVLQKCKLTAKKPMKNQKNMVTAQGRVDPNQNTGTSIQDCEIIASPDLELEKKLYPTYLGRPWKEYSRTVVMQSFIGGHIDPAGWAEWNKDFALKTLYYGEYANKGPGAGTGKRVKWPGFHVITDRNEAKKFTVAELIQGGVWLSSTGVSYTEGL